MKYSKQAGEKENYRLLSFGKKKTFFALSSVKIWWAVAESNCGHEAFQASALPTELTAHNLNFTILTFTLSSRQFYKLLGFLVFLVLIKL
jgi:hypothetical protein